MTMYFTVAAIGLTAVYIAGKFTLYQYIMLYKMIIYSVRKILPAYTAWDGGLPK